MVDEAHATGVLGPEGRGAVAAAGLEGEVDIIVGTLGKALGSYGAYACCDADMARYLVNAARTLIFSTGPAPPVVAAALTALELVREKPRRIERVRRNAQTLRDALGDQGLAVPAGETAIVPLRHRRCRTRRRSVRAALQRGVFAQAIRPPTVPDGHSRLRLAAMSSHNAAELEWAAAQIGAAVREAGATRSAPEQRSAILFDHARAA